MKFSNAVVKQFHKVVECPVTVVERARLLESMEEMFTIPEFIYEDDSKRILGMKYLLGTWEVLLDGLNDVRTRDRYIFFRIITEIIIRREFLLEENGYDKEAKTVLPNRKPLLQKYSSLLASTCSLCEGIIGNTASSAPVLFASKVLAMACLRLPLLRETLFSSFSKLYPPSVVATPDLTKDIFVAPLHREDSRLSRSSGRHLLKRVSQSYSLHRSHSHLLLNREKEGSTLIPPNSEIQLERDEGLMGEGSTLKGELSMHLQQQQQLMVLQSLPANQVSSMEEGNEMTGMENHGLKRPMSLNNLADLNRGHFNEKLTREMEIGSEGLLLEEGDGREKMEDEFSDGNDDDDHNYNYNYNYKEEEEEYDDDSLLVDEPNDSISAICHLFSDQTYDLNVVNEIVLPSSVPPSPSPSPLYRKSEFSPIPSKSPLPSESQEIEEEEKALEVRVDIQSNSSGNDSGNVDSIALERLNSQVLNLKDYTAVSDHQCMTTLKQPSNREMYHTVRTALPSLFEWEMVVERTCYQSEYESFPKTEWWQNRFHICDGLALGFIRSWIEGIQQYQQYANTQYSLYFFHGYYLLLRTMLPLFQKAILLQYNVSLQQRQGQPQASEMIAAVNRLLPIIASEEEWIISITVDMLFHRCNIFVYNDILFCCRTLHQWMDAIREKLIIKSSIDSIIQTLQSLYLPYSQSSFSLPAPLPSVSSATATATPTHQSNDDDRNEQNKNVHSVVYIAQNSLIQELLQLPMISDETVAKNVIDELISHSILHKHGELYALHMRKRDRFCIPDIEKIELPPTFPFSTLFHVVDCLLQQDHLYTIKRALLFLYRDAFLITGKRRIELFSEILLKRHFFKLFWHYDETVRYLFHLILLYSLFRLPRCRLPCLRSCDLLAMVDEEVLNRKWIQIKGNRLSEQAQSQFAKLYNKWRKKQGLVVEVKKKVIVQDSEYDELLKEQTAVDYVLSSKLDSYLVMVIQYMNENEQHDIPRNQHNYLYTSFSEYIIELTLHEAKEKKNAVSAVRPPPLRIDDIMKDPKQKE